MSDEQKMSEVIGIKSVPWIDGGTLLSPCCESEDEATPYLRCDIDPDDAVVVDGRYCVSQKSEGRNLIMRWGKDIDTIATLTAERDALRGDVQAAIDTIKQNQANPTDKYVEQRTMYLLDRLTTALAQLKEQDDD